MTKVCLMCGDTFPDSTTFCPKDGAALRAAVQGDDLIGEVFCERYVVTDLLGEGGMGAVYVARDVRLPQQVAIKVLRERAMADQSTVARFRAEAEAASRINHDRVARVTDFGFMSDGRAFLVMEYVAGRTLKQVITDRGPLSLEETARITRMVAEGLDAAHRLGIVHRDLKPDNVMIVDDDPGAIRLKLLDFGIAKVLASEDTASRTATGFIIGTPQWMSPEQILGGSIDARSDVYAMALLVYSMMTGRRAFTGATPEQEMMTRLTALPVRLADVMPKNGWPDELQQLLDQTLSREASARPTSALSFAQQLLAISNREVANRSIVRDDVPVALTEAQRIATPASAPLAKATTARPFSASSSKKTESSNKRRNLIGVAFAVGAAALLFFGVRQWRANGSASSVSVTTPQTVERGVSGNATNGTPTVTAIAPDSANKASTVVPPTDSLATAQTPRASGSAAAPRTNNAVLGSSRLAAAIPTAPRPRPIARDSNATAVNAQNAAHKELVQVMDEADADVGDRDGDASRAKAQGTIRKLELLTPKLSALTDRGNAYFYIGMSQATLGENDKACASVKRAQTFASQSSALQRNVEQWQQLLKCSPLR